MRSKKNLSLYLPAVALCLASEIGAAQPAEVIIRDGVIVTAAGRSEGDIRVRDGAVAEIGQNLAGSAGALEIDATGLLVFPGGVDPATHIGRDDDYTSGSAAALAGGVTRISNFAFPQSGELAGALARLSEVVRAQTIADVMLHAGINRPNDQQSDVTSLPELGQTSVKVFMNRPP